MLWMMLGMLLTYLDLLTDMELKYENNVRRLLTLILNVFNKKKFIKRLIRKKNCINLHRSLYYLILELGNEKKFDNDKIHIEYYGVNFILVNKPNCLMLVEFDKELIKL
jgi:hypothetical protein